MKFIKRFFISVVNYHRFEEPFLLLVASGVAGGLWGFIELADEIEDNETHAVDRRILLAMRTPGNSNDPLGPVWFEEAVRDITALGGVTVLTLITIAVVCYLFLQRKTGMAWMVVVAVAGGMILSTVLKGIFLRPRPDVVSHLYQVFQTSFPSGHSMMAAVTYLTLGALLAKSQPNFLIKSYIITVAFMFTALVGISRIYLGVHWPTDVLGGWAAGAVWALFWWLLAHWLQLVGKLKTEEKIPPQSASAD
jgi:undecaprenyl-diphosphatase